MSEPIQSNTNEARPAPAGAFRWLVLLSVSVAMFGNYYVFDALNPIGPMLEKELKFSQAQIGALDSAYNVAALLVLLLGGVIIDRVGTKRAMIGFGVVTAIGGFLIASFPHYFGMASGRFVLGLGAEPLIVAATTVLGRWFKGREISFAMGINLLVSRLGSVAADRSAGWASPLFTSWQPPLLLAAAIGLTCIVGGIAYALLERHAERRYDLGRAAATDKLVLSDLVSFHPAYFWVVGLCVAFYSAVFPFRRFANIFFIDAHGASPEMAGQLNSLLPMTAMFATPLFGLLIDKIGKRALMMALGSVLLIPAFLIMAYTHVPLTVPVALLGVSFSLIPAVMWPSVTYLVDEKRLGTAYALMTFFQQIGWAAMAWAVGFLNDRYHAGAQNPGGYLPGMWCFAALGIVGLFAATRLWLSERGPHGHGLEKIRPASQGAEGK